MDRYSKIYISLRFTFIAFYSCVASSMEFCAPTNFLNSISVSDKNYGVDVTIKKYTEPQCKEKEDLKALITKLKDIDRLVATLNPADASWLYYQGSRPEEMGQLLAKIDVHILSNDPKGPYVKINIFIDPDFETLDLARFIMKVTLDTVVKRKWYKEPIIGFVIDVPESDDIFKKVAQEFDMKPSAPKMITHNKKGNRWFKYLSEEELAKQNSSQMGLFINRAGIAANSKPINSPASQTSFSSKSYPQIVSFGSGINIPTNDKEKEVKLTVKKYSNLSYTEAEEVINLMTRLKAQDRLIPPLESADVSWLFFDDSNSKRQNSLVAKIDVSVLSDDPKGSYANLNIFVDSDHKTKPVIRSIMKIAIDEIIKRKWNNQSIIGFVIDIPENEYILASLAQEFKMGPSFSRMITPTQKGARWFRYLSAKHISQQQGSLADAFVSEVKVNRSNAVPSYSDPSSQEMLFIETPRNDK